VPQPDPVPSPDHSLMRRFWRIFRLLALLSVIVATIAVVLVTRGDDQIRASVVIATGLGVGLTMLLGTGLMTLLFLSSSSGHDEQATPRIHQESDDE
jgi:hypothetical protein